MRYTSNGLQIAVLKEMKLNADDSLIIRFLQDFMQSGNMQSIIHENHEYYWITYQRVLDELQILSCNNSKSLACRFNKYEEIGLIFRTKRTVSGKTMQYIRFNPDKLNKLLFYEKPEILTGEECSSYRQTNDDIDGGRMFLRTGEECSSYSPINNSSNKKKNSSIYVDTPDKPKKQKNKQEYYELTDQLINNLIDYNSAYATAVPKLGTPAYEKWVDNIRLLIEIDKRPISEVTQVLEWVRTYENGDFDWQSNIRSTAKFRKQYPNLLSGMMKDRRCKKHTENKVIDKGMQARIALEETLKKMEENKKNVGQDDGFLL